MLTKLEVYFFEGETYHISDLNIYFNLRTKQYRHLFFCDECGVKVGCFGYNHLNEAIEDVEYGYVCKACCIEDLLDSLDIEYIAKALDEVRYNKIINAIASRLLDETLQFYGITREEVREDEISWDSLRKILMDTEKYDELKKFAVSLMTEDEKEACVALVEYEEMPIAGNLRETAGGEAIANI